MIAPSIFPGALLISAGGVRVSRPARKYHFEISTVVDGDGDGDGDYKKKANF